MEVDALEEHRLAATPAQLGLGTSLLATLECQIAAHGQHDRYDERYEDYGGQQHVDIHHSIRSSPNSTGALELAPAHFHVQELLGRRQQLRDVHGHDEEEAIEDRKRHEPQIFFSHCM